jgi:hypothetical protein
VFGSMTGSPLFAPNETSTVTLDCANVTKKTLLGNTVTARRARASISTAWTESGVYPRRRQMTRPSPGTNSLNIIRCVPQYWSHSPSPYRAKGRSHRSPSPATVYAVAIDTGRNLETLGSASRDLRVAQGQLPGDACINTAKRHHSSYLLTVWTVSIVKPNRCSVTLEILAHDAH